MRRALVHASLALAVLLWPADGGRLLAAASPGQAPTPAGDAAALDERELASLLRQVQDRIAALDRRERELAERERSLVDLTVEASRSLDQLEALRGQVEQRIATLEALQGDGVGRLARMYGAMPPARAAALLEQLDPEVATAVVGRMKGKRSAAVLASMAPESALRVSRATALPLSERADDEAAEPAPPAPPPARRVR